MAWTTIEANTADLAAAMQSFADESGTSSIDDFSVMSIGKNRAVALVDYTEA